MNWDYDDALVTADRHVFFKYMVKSLAEKHGLRATFMPKPFSTLTGNGCHAHVSVWNNSGRINLFHEPEGELGISALGYRFLGGIMHRAPALCALWNPTVNSYKRINAPVTLSGATWSPNVVAYGGNNRSTMVRIPDAGRFELRLMDGAANPYLLQAGVVVAGLDGIENERDPGARTDLDLYAEGHKLRGARKLPLNLLDAAAAFRAGQGRARRLRRELRQELRQAQDARVERPCRRDLGLGAAQHPRLLSGSVLDGFATSRDRGPNGPHLPLSPSPEGGGGNVDGTAKFSLSAPGGGEGRGEVGVSRAALHASERPCANRVRSRPSDTGLAPAAVRRLVRAVRVELTLPKERVFETRASTASATPARGPLIARGHAKSHRRAGIAPERGHGAPRALTRPFRSRACSRARGRARLPPRAPCPMRAPGARAQGSA